MQKLTRITLLLALAFAPPAFAQAADPYAAATATNTGKIAETQAQMYQQMLTDANVRMQQLQEAVSQTAKQQALLEQQLKANQGYIPAEYVYTKASAEIAKVNEQMNQMAALSHVYSDLGEKLEEHYPGAGSALPEGYDIVKFQQDMLKWQWTVQANAKGVLKANQEASGHWLEQEGIGRIIEAAWTEDLTPLQTIQMLMMLSTENLRQMVRLRQETANFTSTISTWLAGQAQKEINAIRMAQQAGAKDAAYAGSGKYQGFSTDASKGLYAPHQLGWKFRSPLGN